MNAEVLRLSGVSRIGATLIMRPRVLGAVDAFGLAAKLVCEDRVSRSAGAMLVMSARVGADRFEIGRVFYRLWLELTRLGFAACPMSALVDYRRGADALRTLVDLGDEEMLINVFRVGIAPCRPSRSPRLPVEDLIIEGRLLDQLQKLQQS